MKHIVAVFAHPDDETFICGGTLARFAAEGVRVTLVCATKGEQGRRLGVPPTATRETLPQLREQELRDACTALGIDTLRFLGYRDKTLEIQPLPALADRVYDELVALQPDTVLTFHERLGGHPDHCTIGAATTRAYVRYRLAAPHSELWFVAWGSMYADPSAHGLAPAQVFEVDVRDHLRAKLYAFRAHRTQSQMSRGLWGKDEQAMRELGHREYFIRYEAETAASSV
ncbi:MAG: PIG-L family deacetylase [Alicyclobacillus sp.]|nr:PIG-L family deacetylase [Alicyclobacillus sp.]